MENFAGSEYDNIGAYVTDRIGRGDSWAAAENLFVSPEGAKEEFMRLREDEMLIPPNMDFFQWIDYIAYLKKRYDRISNVLGISNNKQSKFFIVPTDQGSSWVRYKNYLLGKNSGKQKMSGDAVTELENNCHWILSHLQRDNGNLGPVKGLVMGSIQSGKTASMIGLTTMAADYDWNIFVVLSGTIENLRRQTRNRFCSDLIQSGGVSWHILDYGSNPDYMTDLANGEKYLAEDLSLNVFQEGNHQKSWMHRYVIVCLKNPGRLRNLIEWLHGNKARAARMRIVVFDDEADQASVNTAKMGDADNGDEVNRTAVNQLIIDLIMGRDAKGNVSDKPFQAMNYICYTATPYANVLNEAYRESLYPGNFICSLPESDEYFGAKVIFGSKIDDRYDGINIVRTIPDDEIKELKQVHKGKMVIPVEMRKSVAWFLCAAAILRLRGHKKPISMLIHTTSIQNGHFEEYEALKGWLRKGKRKLLPLCRNVYEEEKNEFRLSDLKAGYPNYALIEEVDDSFPEYSELELEIKELLSEIVNIKMGEEKKPVYSENAVHLCVDNCRANKYAEEETYLRISYPSEDELSGMSKAPVFIVMGGNTLSRGLTLEGLVCTYFGRNVSQADTLMQMARWFGYRKGYELLQRIWMPQLVQRKFELMEEIDERLKNEIEDYMEKGKSPSTFGPRIMNSSPIVKFTLTSKNKSQNMIACDVDFSGWQYEVAQFENDKAGLSNNLFITEKFLASLGTASKSNSVDGSFVWRNVNSSVILSDFLDKYRIFPCSSLYQSIPIFIGWIKKMNEEEKFLKWNVAVAGAKTSQDRWIIAGANVGKITRSKKKKVSYIDIGSMRSGPDVLSDIDRETLSPELKKKFDAGKKSRKNLIPLRYKMGYEDTPLLLLYRIDKDKGNNSANRSPIGSYYDIISFSLILAGEVDSNDYVKTVTVKIPD